MDFAGFCVRQESMFYEVPGGNQVDGLPPAASFVMFASFLICVQSNSDIVGQPRERSMFIRYTAPSGFGLGQRVTVLDDQPWRDSSVAPRPGLCAPGA